MKQKLKKLIRPGLFVLGGALLGLGYYALFGCRNGCLITSSPWRTMIYTGILGGLLSVLTGKEHKNGCST